MRLIRFWLPLLLQTVSFFATAQTGQPDIDSLMNIVRQDPRDSVKKKALDAMGDIYSRPGMAGNTTFLYQLIEYIDPHRLPIPVSYAYARLIYIYQDRGLHDSTSKYIGLLKRLTADHPNIRLNYTQAMGLYYKRMDNLKAALPFMLESLDSNKTEAIATPTVRNRIQTAGATLNVGNIYMQMGEYQQALRYHLDALKRFEEVANKKGISFCYQAIGSDFLELDQVQQATSYTWRSLALKTELKDSAGIASSLAQLGSIHAQTKQLDSAVGYYQRSIKLYQKLGYKREEIRVDLNLANAYFKVNRMTEAKQWFEAGRTLSRETDDTAKQRLFEAGLVAIQDKEKDQRLGERKLISSLQNSIEGGDKDQQIINYNFLSLHYAQTGEVQKALDYLNKARDLRDSLQGIKTQVQLKTLEGQYNLEKKEREIALLKKDQELSHLNLEKQKATLAKQKTFEYGAIIGIVLLILIGFLVINRYRIVHQARRAIELEKMRNHIARDLHDDIGSTLTSINIMSKVALATPDAHGIVLRANLQKIKDRSSAIMEKMDDIVWTINPQNDTMEQLLYRMKEFAAEMLEPLNINYSFEEQGDFTTLKLDIRKRKDLYLLFKEAVNNAAKYSQCRNLHIRLRQEGDSLKMDIVDDGKGFAQEGLKGGNGLNNMRERAASMVADIRIDSAVGEGTRIGLELPIS